MRPRKRAGALLLGAGVLFLIGTSVKAGWLLVIAALLVGATVAGFLLSVSALRGLSASLVVPEEAEQGVQALAELRLVNRSRSTRWNVVAIDRHLAPAEVLVPAVRPRERVELATLRITARRGEIVTSSVELRSSAPFGVAQRRLRVPVQARTLVLPRMFPLGMLPFVEPVPTNEPATRTAPRRGHGPDYLGVRDYRTGDSMRHVHWGLTARHGQVMVREFEEERTRRVAIALDTERDRGETWTPLDRACAAAASIADAAGAHGHGSRLIAAMPDGEIDILARADLHEQLRWLARLAPSGVSLAATLDRLGSDDLRGVETLVLLAPAWPGTPADGLAAAVRSLTDRLARVVGVTIAVADDVEPADGLARSLGAAGVDARPWGLDADLAEVLVAEPVR